MEADTSSYGTQVEIFNPPSNGGIQEPNRCPPTRYGVEPASARPRARCDG